MGQFDNLLHDISGQMKGLTVLIENTLARVNGLSSEVADLKAEYIRLQEASKWDHKERRQDKKKSETRNGTLERIMLELDTAKKSVDNHTRELDTLKKRLTLSSNRRWTLAKMLIGGILTAALTIFTAWATAKVSTQPAPRPAPTKGSTP